MILKRIFYLFLLVSLAAIPMANNTRATEVSEVVRVCQSISAMKSVAVVRTLAENYKGTPMADCASARLEELKRGKAAAPAGTKQEKVEACDGVRIKVAESMRCAKPKDVFKDCPTCPAMVVIPEGSFTMGSQADEKGRFDNEGPQREVTIAKPFAVGKFEVTVAQFEAFMKSSGYKVGSKCHQWTGKEYKEKPGSYRSPGFKQSGNHPAACINWKDATAYASWLSKTTGKSYRLFSEAEWEYAARAGKQTRFSFGDKEKELCGYCNHADKSTSFSWKNKTCSDGVGEQTAKVGSFKANTFGLYDMHGNLWEWTRDCWIDNYKEAPQDGTARTTGDCGRRVLRGGSWNNSPRNLRSANRNRYTATNRFNSIGFRISRTLNP